MRSLWMIVLVISVVALGGCKMGRKGDRVRHKTVPKLAGPLAIDGNWDKAPWRRIPPERLEAYMGEQPEHRPKTQVKMAYDHNALYLIFRVEDRYVRAVAPGPQGPVYLDSCVEFFFTPGPDLSIGYFNLEMNCGGTLLFAFQHAPGKGRIKIAANDCSKITVAHSLPNLIDPEITEPVTWTIEYRIPIEILKNYCPVVSPAPGAVWRANFYKCADQTSHPHWLTWAPVDFPKPQFHLPEFFGVLEFK